MTFAQYPDDIAVTILCDTDGVLDLAAITPDDNTQLEYFGVQLFKLGILSTGYMTIRAYDGTTLIGESERIYFKDIPTETNNFYGWFRFNFNPRLTFLSTQPTRFELKTNGYTFSESNWLGFVYDWPTQMGYNDFTDQIQSSPVAIDMYGAN